MALIKNNNDAEIKKTINQSDDNNYIMLYSSNVGGTGGKRLCVSYSTAEKGK